MIKFIFKIIFFEPTPDHKDNVMRSFLFIWLYLSIFPTVLLYFVYSNLSQPDFHQEYIFWVVEILIVAFIYYVVMIRQAKIFIESDLGKKYYDFGKYNAVLKPLVIMLIFGLIVMVGVLGVGLI